MAAAVAAAATAWHDHGSAQPRKKVTYAFMDAYRRYVHMYVYLYDCVSLANCAQSTLTSSHHHRHRHRHHVCLYIPSEITFNT